MPITKKYIAEGEREVDVAGVRYQAQASYSLGPPCSVVFAGPPVMLDYDARALRMLTILSSRE